MSWKFWKKNDNEKAFSHAKKQGFEKPRELPEEVGRHLVVQQGADPDWVWSLKCLRSPKENSSSQFNIRIFSPETMAQHNVKVTNYASLEEHMDLVIFVGWYDKKTQNVQIDRLIKEVV